MFKKLWFMLFFVLLLSACGTTGSYKIDSNATAAAPWKVGEVVIAPETVDFMDNAAIYRKFLGVTPDGYYLVQEFFADGDKKHTEPYLLTKKNAVAGRLLIREGDVHGQLIQWYANGNKMLIHNYLDGIQHGPTKEWHPNGRHSMTGNFTNGKGDGEWAWWYENGQLKVKGNLINDERDGRWRWWYESGQQRFDVQYTNGQRHGVWKEWYENGQLRLVGEFSHDERVGFWQTWDQDGNLTRQADYDAGESFGCDC